MLFILHDREGNISQLLPGGTATRVVIQAIISCSGGFKETKDDGKKVSCCGLRVTGLPAFKAKLNLNIKVSCSRSVKLAEEDGLPGS